MTMRRREFNKVLGAAAVALAWLLILDPRPGFRIPF